MATSTSSTIRQYAAAVRALLVLTVILGLAYPLVMTGISRVAFSANADGSLVQQGSRTVGSDLIGQSFTSDPSYFQSRPSAAGQGYDPLLTSASNLGPENEDLISAVTQRREAAAGMDGVSPEQVPPDALLASGSGLDPHISPDYARQQVQRVAAERGVSPQDVMTLVDDHTEGRVLGFLGEARVNVLTLNLALDALAEGLSAPE